MFSLQVCGDVELKSDSREIVERERARAFKRIVFIVHDVRVGVFSLCGEKRKK